MNRLRILEVKGRPVSRFPSTCDYLFGGGIKVNASDVVPENAWSSITSFLWLLVEATRNGTSSFCANHVIGRRVRPYDPSGSGIKAARARLPKFGGLTSRGWRVRRAGIGLRRQEWLLSFFGAEAALWRSD